MSPTQSVDLSAWQHYDSFHKVTAGGESLATHSIPDSGSIAAAPSLDGHLSDAIESVDDADVDGMGIFGATNGLDGQRARTQSDYFGPSSTVTLLDKVRRAVYQKHSSDESVHAKKAAASCAGYHDGTGSISQASKGSLGIFKSRPSLIGMTVPPRVEADILLGSYWTAIHSLYPFLHRPSFEKRYLAIWNAFSEGSSPSGQSGFYDAADDTSFYCMLNTVFALGALFNPNIIAEDRERISDTFFRRAKNLLDLDILASGSIALVQILLLMGQYLQSTDMSGSCWTIIGLAIRMAQCIGLHQEPKDCGEACCRHKRDQLASEMRRRTWAGCVLLDRVLSLTYGRPLMIHPISTQTHLVLPEGIDDEFLTQPPNARGSQPDGIPSITECYVQAIKLQDILGQVLAMLYTGNSDESSRPHDGGRDSNAKYMTVLPGLDDGVKNSDFQVLLNIDSRLTTWHKELPPHLQVHSYQDGAAPLYLHNLERTLLHRRQATILKARYANYFRQ